MNTHPALLYAGNYFSMQDFVYQYLCDIFCTTGQPGCLCHTCQQIKEHEHVGVTWVEPTREYILKDLDPIFARIMYELEESERHFFVIQHAEQLSVNCANKLLKVLEEPPRGYQFILISNNYHAVLPTIQSRCHSMHTQTEHEITPHPLLSFFTDAAKLYMPFQFEKALKEYSPSVHDATLIAHQLHLTLNVEQFGNPPAAKEALIYALKNPPLPGGSTLFLKNLYLGFATAMSRQE